MPSHCKFTPKERSVQQGMRGWGGARTEMYEFIFTLPARQVRRGIYCLDPCLANPVQSAISKVQMGIQ